MFEPIDSSSYPFSHYLHFIVFVEPMSQGSCYQITHEAVDFNVLAHLNFLIISNYGFMVYGSKKACIFLNYVLFPNFTPFYIISNTHDHFFRILQISEFLFFNNLPHFSIVYSTNNNPFPLIKVKIQSSHSFKETMKWNFAKAFC